MGRTTWVKSKDLTWLNWIGAHSIYVDIYNLSSWLLEFSWCMSYKLLSMSLHSKLAFYKIYLYHALLYLEPKHGLLASTFKVLIGLPLVILLARQEKQDMMKNTSVTNMRARTLPSQNACRVKADGMGPSYRRRFPLRSYTRGSTITVIIYVRRYVWM